MGNIETPILLTSTTSVPRVADALISYMLGLPGNEDVLSINPLVGETNDGYLSDVRGRHITAADVFGAVKNAKSGPVEEGAVGAGIGTVVFGWKDGLRDFLTPVGGESKWIHGWCCANQLRRRAHDSGAPVGQELGRYYLRKELEEGGRGKDKADGSCMIVVATDPPLHAQPEAVGSKGMARGGPHREFGISGGYAIAFSTAP
jgi:D-aminopeptidase